LTACQADFTFARFDSGQQRAVDVGPFPLRLVMDLTVGTPLVPADLGVCPNTLSRRLG